MKDCILAMAFKEYARERGEFDNQPEYIRQEENDRLDIYWTYDNCIELQDKAEQEGWKCVDITGSDRLVQIKLWFEYNTQFVFYKQEYLDDMERKQENNDRKIWWHRWFRSISEWVLDCNK